MLAYLFFIDGWKTSIFNDKNDFFKSKIENNTCYFITYMTIHHFVIKIITAVCSDLRFLNELPAKLSQDTVFWLCSLLPKTKGPEPSLLQLHWLLKKRFTFQLNFSCQTQQYSHRLFLAASPKEEPPQRSSRGSPRSPITRRSHWSENDPYYCCWCLSHFTARREAP